jgi:dihydroorotate dehydrogenase
VPAEAAHLAAFGLIRVFGRVARVPGAAWLLGRWLGPRDPVLRVRALGLEFPGPVGLAAGFDKDARGTRGLAALGFGFVEVGTVTARAQPGNPRPRMFRLTADRALVNKMGFNNAGAAAAAARLGRSRRPGGPVVGVNIGKTRAVPDADAAADYAASARAVAAVADYVVVNVSSPNTPGLRDLQSRPALDELLAACHAARGTTPLFLKLAPDLDRTALEGAIRAAIDNHVDALIVSNTTISRPPLRSKFGGEAGGLSGAPLRALALAKLIEAREASGGQLPLISAGGIDGADEARRRIDAGASLVQLYSALVFKGPGLVRAILGGLGQPA